MLLPVTVIQFVREAVLPQGHPGTRDTHIPNSAQRRFITLEEQVGAGWGELAKAGCKKLQQASKQQAASKEL